MNWYHLVFELIDMRSFSNLWYWIMLAVVWSSASHWVLGIPFDLIMQARRQGEAANDDLQALARINSNRLLGIVQVSGLWLAGMVFFVLSVLCTLGFYYRVEFAQAVFLIIAPITVVGLLSLRMARRVTTASGTAELVRLLTRHRIVVQGIGMLSILVTSMWGMYQNMQIGVFGY
ncbi:MAG: component of SufBCD complex [Cereibacter sphaeroides]|uniref:Component of SufBCD complex n=1 Tax=Cereibacter sphaeroides TaxID=1063 RepID=A0A2W5SDE9_CERSP|nr:MAG: component of SufBCD complex [Cereibacter sphaeroides]